MDVAVKASFGRANGLFAKIRWIVTLWTIVPWLILGTIIHVFWTKLNPTKLPNRKMQKISEILYTIEGYGPVPVTTRMLIFRNPTTNKLALVSPLKPEPATVEEVTRLGEVDAIIVPSLGHDSYAPAWSKLFPAARIAAPAAIRAKINEMYKSKGVPAAISQPEILIEYPGVFAHTPPDGCISTGEDLYEVINDDRRTRTLCTFDLQVNNSWSNTYFPQFSGFGEHCTARMFRLLFVSDSNKFRNFMLNVVCKISNVSCMIFAHGQIIEGVNVSSRIAAAVARDF